MRLRRKKRSISPGAGPDSHVSYANASSSYSLTSGNAAAFQKRGSKKVLVAALVIIAIACAIGWHVTHPSHYDITVNGRTIDVDAGTTLRQVIYGGYAKPEPGDLIAVDDSVIAQGGGKPYAATVNDEPVDDPDAPLPMEAVVIVENGADVYEDYAEEIERLPYRESSREPTAEAYFDGSVHLYSKGVDGVQAVRTGAISGITVKDVTTHPIDRGYTVYTPDVGDDMAIALTFDDGPWPETTEQILDILEENDAHATFFVIGEQCAGNADVLKRMVEAGDQVATHTFDHATRDGTALDLSTLSQDDQVAEVNLGFKAINDVLDIEVSRMLRAPGGNYHGELVRNLEPYVVAEIGWDVDTRDWEQPGVDAIVAALLAVQPGQIVLMHDGGGDRSQTVEALRVALPVLRERGYSFVTVDDILAYGVSSN